MIRRNDEMAMKGSNPLYSTVPPHGLGSRVALTRHEVEPASHFALRFINTTRLGWLKAGRHANKLRCKSAAGNEEQAPDRHLPAQSVAFPSMHPF